MRQTCELEMEIYVHCQCHLPCKLSDRLCGRNSNFEHSISIIHQGGSFIISIYLASAPYGDGLKGLPLIRNLN